MSDSKSARFVVGGVYKRIQGGSTIYGSMPGAVVNGHGRRMGSIHQEGHAEDQVVEGNLGPWELVAEPLSVELADRLEKAAIELPHALALIEDLRLEVQRLSLAAGIAPRSNISDPVGSLAGRRKPE